MSGSDQFVSCNGLRLHYIEVGDAEKPTVVLLHGLRSSARTWDALVASLGSQYHTISLDLRGRGESDWPQDRDYRPERYVEDLEQVADRVCPATFVLVGHSLGGAIGYVYAAAHPDRVRGLVVEDMGPLTNPPFPGAKRIAREMEATPTTFASWDAAEAFVRMLRPGVSEAVLSAAVESSLKEIADRIVTWKYDLEGLRGGRGQIGDLRPAIEALRCPTLVLRGENSDILLPDNARWVAAANPNIRCVEIGGAGHFVHDDQAEDFNREVAEFLSSLEF